MDIYDFQNRFSSGKPQKELADFLKGEKKGVVLKGLYGSSKACSFADAVESYNKGVHLVVLNNIEQAKFFTNDLYGFVSDRNVFYFPTSVNANSKIDTIKESSNKVQRSAAINALNHFKNGESKDKCLELKAKIEERLRTKLHLKLSYASIQPLRHGINFAGFVTYRERRFLRKFSQRNFNRKLKKWPGKTKSLQAHLAHARHTASFGRMAARIVVLCPELINYLTGSIKYDLLKFAYHHRGA